MIDTELYFSLLFSTLYFFGMIRFSQPKYTRKKVVQPEEDDDDLFDL